MWKEATVGYSGFQHFPTDAWRNSIKRNSGTSDPWFEPRTSRLWIKNYTSKLGYLPPLASCVRNLLFSVGRGHNKLRPDAVLLFSCTDTNTDRSLEYLLVLPIARTWKQWEPTQQPGSFVLRTYIRTRRKRSRDAACWNLGRTKSYTTVVCQEDDGVTDRMATNFMVV